MGNSTQLDVFAIIFTHNGKIEIHVHKRLQKYGQAFYSMSSLWSELSWSAYGHTCGGQFAVLHFYPVLKLFLS